MFDQRDFYNFYPDVDGAYSLEYQYKSDNKKHLLQCVLNSESVDGEADTGERFEAVSIYLGDSKITIGTECDFDDDNEIQTWFGADNSM